MPTRNEIITELYLSDDFNDCINKIDPEHLRDDLRAEVILVLLELDEDKIFDLHINGKLKFYTVRTILNMSFSSTSRFFKKFRLNHVQYDSSLIADQYDRSDFEDRLLKEHIEDAALNEVLNLHWYNKELIALYMQHGNYRAIEAITGIPFGSAYKTIKKSLAQVKCNVMQIKEIIPEKVKL